MNYQKGFIVPLLLALIAILLLGGGTYVYVQKNQKNQPATGSVTLPQATSTTQTSNSQTTDWKTYTNAQYGFEFKFPPELKGNTSGDGFMGSVYGNSVNLLVNVVDENSALAPNMPSRFITVAGVNSVEYYSKDSKVIYIPLNQNSNKQIRIDAELPYADIDRILPTFKFNP